MFWAKRTSGESSYWGMGPFKLRLPILQIFSHIVLFGDVLQSKVRLNEADGARPDEGIDYKPDRAYMIFGARNANMSVLGPDVARKAARPWTRSLAARVPARCKD